MTTRRTTCSASHGWSSTFADNGPRGIQQTRFSTRVGIANFGGLIDLIEIWGRVNHIRCVLARARAKASSDKINLAKIRHRVLSIRCPVQIERACRRHRARCNGVGGVPMSALSPGTVCGLWRDRRYPVSRTMLEPARLRFGLLVANLEEERVAFETVGDLQQRQSQRGTACA